MKNSITFREQVFKNKDKQLYLKIYHCQILISCILLITLAVLMVIKKVTFTLTHLLLVMTFIMQFSLVDYLSQDDDI